MSTVPAPKVSSNKCEALQGHSSFLNLVKFCDLQRLFWLLFPPKFFFKRKCRSMSYRHKREEGERMESKKISEIFVHKTH